MALYSSTPSPSAARRPGRRSLLSPWLVMGGTAVTAIGIVTYLLWPTWTVERAGDPDRLPISIGNTLFNVPTGAIRVKVQRRTGPQERIDLNFAYPSLQPPAAPPHVSAETIPDKPPEIDRIFLSIAAHHGATSPDERLQTIYPRYLDASSGETAEGLTTRPFRENTPYTNEDLMSASEPRFDARCTRDGKTPGMCLSERRIGDADLTFRFPRDWLAQWRDVASAMDRIASTMLAPKS